MYRLIYSIGQVAMMKNINMYFRLKTSLTNNMYRLVLAANRCVGKLMCANWYVGKPCVGRLVCGKLFV